MDAKTTPHGVTIAREFTVKARAASVRAAFEGQALGMVGPHAQSVFDYAYAHQKSAMNAAIRDHVQNENPQAYAAVEQLYWLNLDKHDPEAIMTAQNAAQLQPQRDQRSGVITINIPGVGRTTWAAAVRAGYIGSKRK